MQLRRACPVGEEGDGQRQQGRKDDGAGMWREHMSMAMKAATAEKGMRKIQATAVQRGMAPMMPATITMIASRIQSPAMTNSASKALAMAASPPPAVVLSALAIIRT